MDRKDYVVFGDVEKVDFDFLLRTEEFYRHSEEANRAPELAQKIFTGISDPRELDDRFRAQYESAGPQQQRELGPAYNYAMIKMLFSGGYESVGREFVQGLVDQDGFYHEVQTALQLLGASFVDLCSENETLLTPKRLDQVVFDKYVPKSEGLAERYADVEGIVFVFKQKQGSDISVRVYYDSLSGRSVVQDGAATSFASFKRNSYLLRFEYRGPKKRLEKTITKQLEGLGVKEHCVIRTRTPEKEIPEIAYYTLLRFFTERYGRALNSLVPGIGGDSHRVIPIKKDKLSE